MTNPKEPWMTALTPGQQAAYCAYREAESTVWAAIHQTTSELRAYWRERAEVCRNGTGPPANTNYRDTLESTLDSLWSELRYIQALRCILEQEALRRLAHHR
jgi:hypothetical protein